jgi:hypothetical protein
MFAMFTLDEGHPASFIAFTTQGTEPPSVEGRKWRKLDFSGSYLDNELSARLRNERCVIGRVRS